MIRILILIALLVIGAAGFAWYSAQSLPEWYQQDEPHKDQVTQKLSEQIKQQGVGKFLGDKFADVMRGKLVLSETEFNALLLTSLRSSDDGRRLLNISDAVNADLTADGVEFGAIINLEKAAEGDVKAKQAVEKILQALPFLDKSRVFVAVKGRPIARDGNLAFDQDISVRIGSISLPDSILKQLGVPIHRASSASLPLRMMSISSVSTREGEIELGVSPRF